MAGITISLVLNEGGILGKANQAKEKQEVGQLKDQIGVNIADWYTDKALYKDVTIANLWDKLVQDKIIADAKTDVEGPDAKGVHLVTTNKGYVIEVIIDDKGNVTVGEGGKKDELPPRIVEFKSTSTTTSSIAVKAEVTRIEDGGKLSYYYKKSSETEYKALKENTTDKTADYTGLAQNEVYDLKLVATNKNGSVEQKISVVTGELASGTISQKGTTTWSTGTASIELQTTDTTNTMQYQKNGIAGSWTNYTIAITGLVHGDIIYARMFDGVNGSSPFSISIMDGIAPTVTETSSNATTDSVSLAVTAVDNGSGMLASSTYTFYRKVSTEADSSYIKDQESASNSYIKTGLLQNTTYTIKVETKDKANNIGSMTKNMTTGNVGGATGGLTTGNVIASSPTWANGTASITLSTSTGLSLQWQKNAINSSDWITGTSITGLNHGDTLYARLTDGTNYGDSASVSIVDGIIPQNATINLSNTSAVAGKAITAKVTQSDGQSGVDISNCKWVYNTTSEEIGTNVSSYPNAFSSNPQTISLNEITAGTYYLHVLTTDIAGNKKERISEEVIVNIAKDIGKLTEIQAETVKAKDDKENIVTVPKGFKVLVSEGTTVQQGIVIEDKDGNQFVWTPIGDVIKDDGKLTTIQLGRYTFNSSNGIPTLVQAAYTEANLANYKEEVPIRSFYKENSTYRQGTVDNLNHINDLNATAKNLAKFVNSAKTNGGYYLARYEASYGSGSSVTDWKPSSKVSISTSFSSSTPGSLWNNITEINASKVCINMYKDNNEVGVESDLTNSYAWDTAIVYIQEMGNSNYANANRDTTGNVTSKNTGETGDKVCNINDMASNLSEWTTEYFDSAGSPCTYRGGNYGYSEDFATCRYGTLATLNNNLISFRSMLYVK